MKIISLEETVCPVCGKKPEIFGDPYEYYDSKVDNYILSIKNKPEIAANNKEFECSKSEEIDVKTYLKNVIAWSTMYEYFVTGRVDRLSGPAGAYNLYENELRANIIIAKMDVIIEKLDQIKNNQYILYSTLTKISEEARELSDKMDEMLNASQETNRLLGDIYQTEQGIAYNTAKIAK